MAPMEMWTLRRLVTYGNHVLSFRLLNCPKRSLHRIHCSCAALGQVLFDHTGNPLRQFDPFCFRHAGDISRFPPP